MAAQTAVTTARIRGRGQLTLPAEVREALHVAEGDEVEFTRHDDGTVTLRGLKTIPAGQAWFWSPQRQSGQREAGRETAAGDLSPACGSAEDMLARPRPPRLEMPTFQVTPQFELDRKQLTPESRARFQ